MKYTLIVLGIATAFTFGLNVGFQLGAQSLVKDPVWTITSPKPGLLPRANGNTKKSIVRSIVNKQKGIVSYYSRKGCLGCSKDFTMANGKKLDDTKLTIAYNKGKLNRRVKITNQRLGTSTIATVTDRGGFERHNKIADLSVATKNALQCGDVCKVEIEEL